VRGEAKKKKKQKEFAPKKNKKLPKGLRKRKKMVNLC
jgi:hypothetical protein